MSDRCAVCGVPAEQKCAGCKLVAYCGRDHQKLHWKREHKAACKCYKLVSNDQLGRYFVATRDIKRGEVILRERPIVLGPKLVTEPMCLGCNRKLPPPQPDASGELRFIECSGCRWPMCGVACERSEAHVAECAVIGARGYPCPIVPGTAVASGYSVITPLRCLLMRDARPKDYATLLSLEDHLDVRTDTAIYKVLRTNLVSYFHTILGWSHIEPQHIMRIAAILDTNCFEIRPTGLGTKLRGIYPETAMIAHDCVPNTRHVFDDRAQMTVLATVDIPKDAMLKVTYTQLLKSTAERRTHLQQAKCFWCTCDRCRDPSELGSYLGAIRCSRCKRGMLVSTEPLNAKAGWRCEECGHQMPGRQLEVGNRQMMAELERLDKRSPLALEQFLQRYEETLHGRNTHVVQVKYALIQLYGTVPGFRMNELNDAGLQRKIDLCSELLELADIFEPGLSLFRGKILLHLQQAMTLRTKREFNAGLITREAAKEQMMEAMQVLQESVEILRLEPDMPEVEEQLRELAAELED